MLVQTRDIRLRGGPDGFVVTMGIPHSLASTKDQHNCVPSAWFCNRMGVAAASDSSFRSRHFSDFLVFILGFGHSQIPPIVLSPGFPGRNPVACERRRPFDKNRWEPRSANLLERNL